VPTPVARLDKEQVRSWIVGFEQAAALDRAAKRAAGPEGERAIEAALDLIEFVGRLHGWPPRPDPVRDREREATTAVWAKLRDAWPT
jgi:hypothetical protein